MYSEKIYRNLNKKHMRLIVCVFILPRKENSMDKRTKLKLNIKFHNNEVVCAKSPKFCSNCINKNNCETLNVSYNQYAHRDVIECFNNSEKRR